jgi:DNA-binding transcriptional LysR family regulator
MNSNHILHKMMKAAHMNLSQLECLAALAATGSFTEAALSVNLTQSAVSHALAALETELGVRLVERNRKGVLALTAAGQKIVPHARALLAHVESIEQEAKAAQGAATGRLRVGNTLCLCPGLLASVLTRFEKLYPDVEVVLLSMWGLCRCPLMTSIPR